jgi:hypothetical protein
VDIKTIASVLLVIAHKKGGCIAAAAFEINGIFPA